MTHTAKLDDVCAHTHILHNVTLDELHGRIGPQWPVEIDGRAGHLTAEPGGVVRFVPGA